MSTTVQVMDQYGGQITYSKNLITGHIRADILDGRTGEESYMILDPDEPRVKEFLKSTLQPIHLEIFLVS